MLQWKALPVTRSTGNLYPHSVLSTALTAWMFILPALALFVVFVVYPMIQSVYYSLFNWKGFGPLEDYVGFGNYQRILNDAAFLRTLSNGIVLVALSLILQLPLSLALALVVGAIFRSTLFSSGALYAIRLLRGHCSNYVGRAVQSRS
jgi:ABC-type sugar transport system permease subunit